MNNYFTGAIAVLTISLCVFSPQAAAQDSDGSLTAAAGAELGDFNLSLDTVGEAANLFDFTLSDAGGGDGLAMDVSAIVINVSGTSSDSDRAKITWRLNGPDASNFTGAYGGGTISFSSLPISIADDGSEVYTINGYYNDTTGLTDGATIILTVDGDADLTVGGLGTQMGTTSAVSNGSGLVITDDIAPPELEEVTPVTTPTGDGTPDVSFSSTKAGTLEVGGSCGSLDEGAIAEGDNTIRLSQPNNSTPLLTAINPPYYDCTITVTDGFGNVSNDLLLSSFVVDVTDPSVDANGTKSLNEGDIGVIIGNTNLSSSDNLSVAANITYTVVAPPTNGTLLNNGGALAGGGSFTQVDINSSRLTYDHDGSETISDTFTFTVADEVGNINDNGAANFIFNFTVSLQNDPPVTTIDSDSTNEDNAVLVDVLDNDSDPDGSLNPASVTVSNPAASGSTSVNVGTGAITYTPNNDFNGVDSFEYTVEDDDGLTSPATTVSITVNPQNDPPVAEVDTVSTMPNTALSIDVAANDFDIDTGDMPDPASIVVVGAAANGDAIFNGGTNEIFYSPDNGFEGSDTFTYTIDDGFGLSSNVATVRVIVTSGNANPTALADSAITLENTPIVIAVLDNDSDSDGTLNPSSVAISRAPENGSVSVSSITGDVTYTPASGFSGDDNFTYTVEDNDGSVSNISTVLITVDATDEESIPKLVTLDSNGNPTTASVSLGATADNGLTYSNDADYSVGTAIEIIGSIVPVASHVGAAAGIVVAVEDTAGPGTYLLIDATGQFSIFDGVTPVFFDAVILATINAVDISGGTPFTLTTAEVGTYNIFIGYMLLSTGVVYFNNQPLVITVFE